MEERNKYNVVTQRLCKRCNKPFEEEAHGNRKSHPDCARKYKRQHQKEKYIVGNSAKLQIQKNETIAADLYKLDHQKRGISHLLASELGFKFNCHSIVRAYGNKRVHFFDKYGYSIETVNGNPLIYIYHVSELM